MGKFRTRVSGKGKRWLKGQSSISNPTRNKYREMAKSRFFQENLGESALTSDALRKHNAFTGHNIKPAQTVNEDTFSASTVGGTTFKTFQTFASDWSNCSNMSFSKLLKGFHSDSLLHKEMLAILAAITEVIKSQGGKETTTEYFAALMTCLDSSDNTETSIAAIVSLLGMGIKGVPKPVLQSRFTQTSKTLVELLSKFADANNSAILRAILGCLSVLLRAQDLAVWNDSSTLQTFNSILAFTTHCKPKVRKAAQHGVCAVLKGSSVIASESAAAHHPAAGHVGHFCVRQIETNSALGGSTATFHVLALLKETLATLPKGQLKSCCEVVLKVMSLGDMLVTSCGLQALHGLFVCHPPASALTPHLNARLIAALFDYQPPQTDMQPTQAWLATLQEAFINLARIDLSLCVANLPRFFTLGTSLWLSERAEVMNAVTLTMKALLEDCIGPASQPEVVTGYRTVIDKIVNTVVTGLKYQYHTAWTHVLHLIGVLFKVCGSTCSDSLLPVVTTLAELRDSYQFSYTSELDYVVGQAVRTIGPEKVLQAVPLQFVSGGGKEDELKRSWLLPVLRENIQASTLKCFTEKFLPLATICRKESLKLGEASDQVGALSHDLLQSQIWALLPSFCSQPTDIADSFPVMAKALGGVLATRKDLRLAVMTSLRRLILHVGEQPEGSVELKTITRYAKNYLEILFNLYSTQPKGSEEEGIRLAAFETIKVYLSVAERSLCSELFQRAFSMLENNADKFVKESVLDLLRALLAFQDEMAIAKLYDSFATKLADSKDHKQQKKYYRLLEELCSSKSEGCHHFLGTHLADVRDLLVNSLSTSAPTSRGSRLQCLLHLITTRSAESGLEELAAVIIPEAVLCYRDVNARCRDTACRLVIAVADLLPLRQCYHLLMAGLAGSPTTTSSALLALSTVTYHCRETVPEDLRNQLLNNVCLLAVTPCREVVSSALSYIKVHITSFPRDIVASAVPQLMRCLVSMTDDCKRHCRTKTRDLLCRLVRWFGADNIASLVPQSETVMRARLRNMRKVLDRKKRGRNLQQSNTTVQQPLFSVKSKPKSIEQILAESDESDLETGEEVEVRRNRGSRREKRNKAKTWITEGADNIVDFTDSAASKRITVTQPGNSIGGVGDEAEGKRKPAKSGFETAPDGRLIIKFSDSDKEQSGRKQKKSLGFAALSLSDSGDEADMEDDLKSVRSLKSLKSRSVQHSIRGGAGPSGRKRKHSFSSDMRSDAPPIKYQAGGSGIHRPVGHKVKQKSESGEKIALGLEYRSKKAAGDVKRKGLPDPYAYVPLKRNALNRRKKMKYAGQFKSIVKSAKKGTQIGKKNKMKRNK